MAETVTVACKMPHGLVLRVFLPRTATRLPDGRIDPSLPGAEEDPRYQRVTLAGYAVPFGAAPLHQVVGGFAMTHGVDKAFFDEWLKQNADSDIVKNGLVFTAPKADAVQGMAKDRAALRNGLEPNDPAKLPRGVEPAAAAA